MIETDLFSRLMMTCIQKDKFLMFTSSLSSNFKHTQPKRPDKRARIQLKISLHKSFRKTVRQQKYERFLVERKIEKNFNASVLSFPDFSKSLLV